MVARLRDRRFSAPLRAHICLNNSQLVINGIYACPRRKIYLAASGSQARTGAAQLRNGQTGPKGGDAKSLV